MNCLSLHTLPELECLDNHPISYNASVDGDSHNFLFVTKVCSVLAPLDGWDWWGETTYWKPQ